MKDLSNIRQDYNKYQLKLSDLPGSPFVLIKQWLQEAAKLNIPDYNAMVLSTAGKDMSVHSRIVLLREINDEGLIFYTNYNSAKGQEIHENRKVSLLLFHSGTERQIRIEGVAGKTTSKVSDKYFAGRPRDSQLAARVSKQSLPLSSRNDLVQAWKDEAEKYHGKPVPRPENWGGYIVKPDRWEFWQGQAARLHERFVYSLNNSVWKITRLYP